jgi:hypothetical protein
MSTVETATEIKSFSVEVPDEQLDDLRRRIGAARLPSKELVDDRSQGVQLAMIRELAHYWAASPRPSGRLRTRVRFPPPPPQVSSQIRAPTDKGASVCTQVTQALNDPQSS